MLAACLLFLYMTGWKTPSRPKNESPYAPQQAAVHDMGIFYRSSGCKCFVLVPHAHSKTSAASQSIAAALSKGRTKQSCLQRSERASRGRRSADAEIWHKLAACQLLLGPSTPPPTTTRHHHKTPPPPGAASHLHSPSLSTSQSARSFPHPERHRQQTNQDRAA